VQWFRFWNGGNQWAGWASYLSFFRHVAKLPIDYSKWDPWELAAIHGGPRYMHSDFWIVSDFPTCVHRDQANRPHCTTGPALAWRDGWALYFIHGLRVPERIVMQPETITVQEIDRCDNAEMRRVLVSQYGEGKYLLDAGAQVLDSDPRFGTLYRRDQRGDEPLVMVRVINSTPEPDGSKRIYWLGVHPECRPLLPDGTFGEPQKLTARNAVAASFGLRGHEYEPAAES
jgi:hypothetical protein